MVLSKPLPQTNIDDVYLPTSQRLFKQATPHGWVARPPTEQLARHRLHQQMIGNGGIARAAVVVVVGDGVERLVGAEANDVGREILGCLDFAEFVIGNEIDITCKNEVENRFLVLMLILRWFQSHPSKLVSCNSGIFFFPTHPSWWKPRWQPRRKRRRQFRTSFLWQ